ncbi:MAG: hypothetical protein HRT45_00045 [Bdellovibrionales bacterium]|nr:hypothetical protein [Bdellovibrionales bacterium]
MEKLILIFLVCLFSANVRATGCGFPEPSQNSNWQPPGFFERYNTPSAARQVEFVKLILRGYHSLDNLMFSQVFFEDSRYLITVFLSDDYLKLGSGASAFRIPLTNYAAQYLANKLGFLLPTKAIVDRAWEQAEVRLSPQPTDWYKYPGAMRSLQNYKVHHDRVEARRAGRLGLVAGHKKDVIVSERLLARPDRVAIYGWHRSNGRPIQSVSLVHDFGYDDYSHGIRFVFPFARVFDKSSEVETVVDLPQLYSQSRFARVLGESGRIQNLSASLSCPASFSSALSEATASCSTQQFLCEFDR